MHSIIPAARNPALREVAREIAPKDIAAPRIRQLIADMKRLLSKEKFGVALAAPQVGEPVRLFIVSSSALATREHDTDDAAASAPADDLVYINPVITRVSRGRTDKHEGCLSLRGKWGIVPRAEKATVRALDEHGKPFTRNASGFLAHIFQHEMDHLDGVLYIDKATELFDDKEASASHAQGP